MKADPFPALGEKGRRKDEDKVILQNESAGAGKPFKSNM